MEKQYQIVVNIRALQGFAEIARFRISDDLDEVRGIYGQLAGIPLSGITTPVIRFDLLETGDTIHTVLSAKYCSLIEAGENCKTIIKETFRMINLG